MIKEKNKVKSIEVKAKTVHEAIEEACRKLEVSETDVNVEILSQGGMFVKAKVLVTIKDEYLENQQKEQAKKDAQAQKETITQSAQTHPATTANETAKTTAKETKQEKTSAKSDTKETKSEAKAAAATDETQNPADKKFIKFEKKSAEQKTDTQKTPPSEFKSDDIKYTKTFGFVKKLIELLGNDAAVTSEHTDTTFDINVNGENIGRLIGKGGEVLNAIQTLVTSIAISNANGSGHRVIVNIGDYKEKRGDSLKSLALKKAEYVKSKGRFVKLEPMNARDRAIIHTALSEIEGIRTYSTGKDPFRCLCIAPAETN